MPRFVCCDRNRLVNLDHVAFALTLWHSESGTYSYQLFNRQDALIGETKEDIPTLTSREIVPAAEPVEAWIVMITSEGERPTEADLMAWRTFVAAWSIEDGLASPIIFDERADSDTVVLVTPDGAAVLTSEQRFPSLGYAKAAILAEAQAKWDNR